MSFSSPTANGMPRSPKVPISPEMKVVLEKANVGMGGYRNPSRGRYSRTNTPVSRRDASPLHRSPSNSRRSYNVRSASPSHSIRESRDVAASFHTASKDMGDETKQIGLEEMDEVLVRRYLEEKKNCRTLEENITIIDSENMELRKILDEQIAVAQKDGASYEMKNNEQEKMIDALHDTIKNLQDQFTKQAFETGDKIMAVREDADKQIVSIRENSVEKLTALRGELVEVQTNYKITQKDLDVEREKLSEQDKKLKAMERVHETRRIILMEEKEKFVTLEKKYHEKEQLVFNAEAITNEKVGKVSTELYAVKNKYELEISKATELSTELNLISCQYVECQEELEDIKEKEKKLSKDLESKEEVLKEETKKQISVSNQLEEMANGYIETDELLKNQKESNELLTETTTTLKAQLEEEIMKSNELEKQFKLNESSLLTANNELEKFKISCNTLASEVLDATEDFENEKMNKSALSINFEAANLKNKELETKLTEKKAEVESLSSELEEKTKELKLYVENLSLSELKAEEFKTMRDSETTKNLNLLTTELDEVKVLHTTKMEHLSTTEEQLIEGKEKYQALSSKFKDTESELQQLKNLVEKEQEKNKEKFSEERNKLTDIKSDADSMKKQYMDLFDNLVETEEKLEKGHEKIESLEKIIKDKENEIRHSKWKHNQNLQLKDEDVEKERPLTEELETAEQKSKALYDKLVEAEEEILDKADENKKVESKLKEKEEECNQLKIMLEKEKKGVPQRKLKVAKKMIHAEKERQKVLVAEIDAKDVILKRVQNQAETLEIDLEETRKSLESEKERKSKHSSRAIQELHRRLDDERNKARIEKEQIAARVKTEQSKVKTLGDRLKKLEETSSGEALSKALIEQEELVKQVRGLEKENTKLQEVAEEAKTAEETVVLELTEVEGKFKAITESMDTLTKYCKELEAGKKEIQGNTTAAKNSSPDAATVKTEDDLLTIGPFSFSDDESKGDISVLTFSSMVDPPLSPRPMKSIAEQEGSQGNGKEVKAQK